MFMSFELHCMKESGNIDFKLVHVTHTNEKQLNIIRVAYNKLANLPWSSEGLDVILLEN